MTDSDAPKPDQDNSKVGTPDTGKPPQESPVTAAGKDQTNAPRRMDEPQVALEVMAALCREFGLAGLPSEASDNLFSPIPQDNSPQESAETAFEIIQRFLFDGDANNTPNAPTPNFNESIPDPASIIAKATGRNFPFAPDKSEASEMSNLTSETSDSSPESRSAQWGLTTSHRDGSTTDLNGPVIKDDMFRTAMPCLRGNATIDADTPDWTIKMAQGLPLSPGCSNAQTAIGAKLSAANIPDTLKKWHLQVGPPSDAGAKSQLSVSLPTSAPSQLRALLCDTTATDDNSPQMSEVPVYGGGPFALHLEQSIGSTSSEAVPNLALIRLVFADQPPIPAQIEYIGTLPSPIIGGSIMVAPNYSIPFRAQITPPSEGDKGAGLVILVQYNQETSFNVTAQLLTETKTTTPTAILSCTAQGDNAACRAASMVSNSNGRLETSLTGLAETPVDADLPKYGFILPPTGSDTDTGTASGTTDSQTSANDTANGPTNSDKSVAPAKSKASVDADEAAPVVSSDDATKAADADTPDNSSTASTSSARKASGRGTKAGSAGNASKSANGNANTKGDT